MSEFQFKQFSLRDDHSPMKISTDAVLLGAWTNEDPSEILDIGTGCGIIAIMLAQKTNAVIDAVEINAAAAEEAKRNVSACKWKELIHIHPISFKEFFLKSDKKYGLIVSNPPYFSDLLKSPNKLKNLAKHDIQLTFDELISGVKKLLLPEGKFNVILSANESKVFRDKMIIEKLYCTKILEVRPTSTKPVNRLLMQFSFQKIPLVKDEFVIRNNKDFTEEYKFFTKDFYLRF